VGHPPILIRRCTASQRDAAVDTLAEALLDDPFLRWALPEQGYEQRLGELIAADVDEALAADELWAAGELEAVAAWTSPTDRRARESALATLATEELTVLFGERTAAVLEIDRALAAALPTDPVRYLESLGTRRAARRKGYASALLRPALARCDQERVGAALDTSNRQALPFYAGLGFRVVKRVEHPGAPEIWLLVREP
jgi:GNAT superfamily N-acetyltransferase